MLFSTEAKVSAFEIVSLLNL